MHDKPGTEAAPEAQAPRTAQVDEQAHDIEARTSGAPGGASGKGRRDPNTPFFAAAVAVMATGALLFALSYSLSQPPESSSGEAANPNHDNPGQRTSPGYSIPLAGVWTTGDIASPGRCCYSATTAR